MKHSVFYYFPVCLMLMVSCKDTSRKALESDQMISIEISRFEQDIFGLSANRDSMLIQLDSLANVYGEFFSIFNSAVLSVSDRNDPIYTDVLDAYLADRTINVLKSACDSIFPSLGSFRSDLAEAFSWYHLTFPEMPIPKIVTFISGLNQSFVSADSLLGIALDKYLGSDNLVYAQAFIPLYQRRMMIPERMVPDCMRAWIITEFPAGDSVKNLLDHMLYEGRILYSQKQMIPGISDTLLNGYSVQQMEWCRKYENKMWTYLVENKTIFQTDAFTIARFVQDGPFTKDFSSDSPARAAVWIGLQIIESYMKHHPDVDLRELMQMQNLYPILEGSGYNP